MYASACTKPKKVECREYDFPSVSMFLISEPGTVPKVYLANLQTEVFFLNSIDGVTTVPKTVDGCRFKNN